MTVRLSHNDLSARLKIWLTRKRWFAGKNYPIDTVKILFEQELFSNEDTLIDVVIVQVLFNDPTTESQSYQLFIGYRTILPEYLSQWEINSAGEDSTINVTTYEGLHDKDFLNQLSNYFLEKRTIGTIKFHHTPDNLFSPNQKGSLLSTQQSNTSVILGKKVIVKFFRLLSPGINPDLEIHQVLTEANCPSIAKVQGWVDVTTHTTNDQGESIQINGTLAIASEYAENSTDGWNNALASVRDLLAEGDLLASEVGTDFASESQRLGAAVAQIHKTLAEHFRQTTTPINPVERIAKIKEQFEQAQTIVPELEEYRASLDSVLQEALAEITQGTIPEILIKPIRIHGDLHLGQTLRTLHKWIIIDFEGEPIKPVAERQLPDYLLRDIAGMLRSFDYAAFYHLNDRTNLDPQQEFRAREWAARNSEAFIRGYREESDVDPWSAPKLLTALLLEKAFYESAYEKQHRTSWVGIPLGAIQRLVGKSKHI